jgi:hypothetical protein
MQIRNACWFIFNVATLFAASFSMAFPDSIRFTRRNERIIASAVTCSVLESELPNIRAWAERANMSSQCEFSKGTEGFRCVYDISDCVPEHVRRFQGENPLVGGPNCFNLALVMKQILPHLRYSSTDEMSFYMREPICHELQSTETHKPGDIGAIYIRADDNLKQEWHGFVYISDHLAYSKNGKSENSPYSLQTVENVNQTYDVGRENCVWTTNGVAQKCRVELSSFRCKSMDEYLQDTGGMPHELESYFDRVSSVEGCLEQSVISGALLPEQARRSINDVAQSLVHYIGGETASKRALDSKQTFLLGALQMRLESIALQLGKMDDQAGSSRLMEFARAMQMDVPRNPNQ